MYGLWCSLIMLLLSTGSVLIAPVAFLLWWYCYKFFNFNCIDLCKNSALCYIYFLFFIFNFYVCFIFIFSFLLLALSLYCNNSFQVTDMRDSIINMRCVLFSYICIYCYVFLPQFYFCFFPLFLISFNSYSVKLFLFPLKLPSLFMDKLEVFCLIYRSLVSFLLSFCY